MNNFAWAMIAIMFTIGVLAWSESRDSDLMRAADIYEACVRIEYGVSPAYWYAEHGEYPICPKTVAN